MADPERIVTAADLEALTAQERNELVDASVVLSWDDVPETFRSEIQAMARHLGDQRRTRA